MNLQELNKKITDLEKGYQKELVNYLNQIMQAIMEINDRLIKLEEK